jgi:hypothetical protein
MRFCETNPFYFDAVCGVTLLFTETYVVCNGFCKWVRSGKTNPFGGGLWGRFHRKVGSFPENEATGGVATVMSVPRSSPERNSRRAGPEVGNGFNVHHWYGSGNDIAAYQLRQKLHWRGSRSQCCAPLVAYNSGVGASLRLRQTWLRSGCRGKLLSPPKRLRHLDVAATACRIRGLPETDPD